MRHCGTLSRNAFFLAGCGLKPHLVGFVCLGAPSAQVFFGCITTVLNITPVFVLLGGCCLFFSLIGSVLLMPVAGHTDYFNDIFTSLYALLAALLLAGARTRIAVFHSTSHTGASFAQLLDVPHAHEHSCQPGAHAHLLVPQPLDKPLLWCVQPRVCHPLPHPD